MTCIFTTVQLGLFLLLRTALNLGALESHGFDIRIDCGEIMHCTYGGLTEVHAEGSVSDGLGTITASEVTLTNIGGTFCPKTPKLDAVYKIQLPDPVYITT